MADENVLAQAPIRFDDQILPFDAWVPIGKSNFVLDLQKKQKNPIFQISLDILQNTNFFRAFTTSASLDETRFTLDANLLMKALEITPIDQAHQFVSHPSGDAIMDFMNQLGYTEIPVLQMLWGIITSTNVDYAELLWEEFVQAIQTFLTDKANLGSPTKKGRKDKPHVIPYCRFMKIIICHLGRIHNIHQRSASPFHLAEEDFRLGNFKFVPKGKIDEVFGMPIPDELQIGWTPLQESRCEILSRSEMMDIGTSCREIIFFIYNLVRVSILSVARDGMKCMDLATNRVSLYLDTSCQNLGARATGAAPGTNSIWNSTWRTGVGQ
nr:hypothetical protein [Tanacetum cinerariifolium]